MTINEEDYLLTTLKSVLEVLVLIQDDTTRISPMCSDIGDAMNLPILALIECINTLNMK